jgi:tRNA pseudouridine32 synthase/23S rRNA pseudouridine746 synthase
MGDNIDVPVIWEDETILVVNKPPGLLTLPDGYDPSAPHLKAELSHKFGRLWIVHRLDRETSGVIVLARSAMAHRHLNTQFQEQAVSKIYHALVVGAPAWDRKIIELPLKVDGDRRHRTVVDTQNGKESITRLKVLERFNSFCLMEAAPKSGRRHQIRVHLLSSGFPIAGDILYGGGKEVGAQHEISRILMRSALHARSIKLTHPASGEEILFEAQYADDFKSALHLFHRELRTNELATE